jgi:hypothetical protein
MESWDNMKLVFKQAFMSYKMLFNFKDYKNGEIVLKLLLLILVFPIFTIVFIFTWFCYIIERILSPIYKYFLTFHMKMIHKRAHATNWIKRVNSLLTLIVTLLLLPFVTFYYIAMLIKILLKNLLRGLIIKLDFSIQFTTNEVKIFDDSVINKASMEFMFKDASQTEAIGKLLENFINNSPEFLEDEVTDATPPKNNKRK